MRLRKKCIIITKINFRDAKISYLSIVERNVTIGKDRKENEVWKGEKMNYSQKKKFRITAVFLLALLLAACINVKWVSAADYKNASNLTLDDKTWTLSQWLTNTDNEHWYRINIPSDGKLTYKVRAYTFVYYQLFNEDLSKQMEYSHYTRGSEKSPNTDTRELGLSKGTYYLKVWKGSDSGKYDVNASFVSYNATDENAVSYESPQYIMLGSEITGAITQTDEEDWYRISIPSTGYYHYTMRAYTSVAYQLYNEDLSTKVHSWDQYSYGTELSPKTDAHDVVLEKGIYYFKIYKHSYNTGKYSFVFTKLSQDSCDHNYKYTYVEPTYTRKGYTHYKCSKCGRTYNNNYRDKLVLGTPYLYTISAGKKNASVSWSSVYNASGYQILYKINGTKKTLKVAGGSNTRRVLRGLKSKKACIVQVRAYKKEGKQMAYSKWSSKQSARIK